MTHPASGNATWQDYPSTATIIDAAKLEKMETALDSLLVRPSMRKRRTGADSAAITANTVVTVPLDTVDINRNSTGIFSSTTTNAITVLVTGLFLMTGDLHLFGGNSGFCDMIPLKGGSAFKEIGLTTSGTVRFANTWVVPLAANDVITLGVYHERTTAPVFRSTNAWDIGLHLTYLGT